MLLVEHRMVLPNKQTLLCVHSTPGFADGPGIGPHTSDKELATLTRNARADIICVGHTHVSFVREIPGVTVVNPGPVGNPLAPDLRAAYAILDAGTRGVNINQRRIAYDHQAVIDAVERSNYPAAPFIVAHQLGRHTVEDMVKALSSRRYMIKENSKK